MALLCSFKSCWYWNSLLFEIATEIDGLCFFSTFLSGRGRDTLLPCFVSQCCFSQTFFCFMFFFSRSRVRRVTYVETWAMLRIWASIVDPLPIQTHINLPKLRAKIWVHVMKISYGLFKNSYTQLRNFLFERISCPIMRKIFPPVHLLVDEIFLLLPFRNIKSPKNQNWRSGIR